MFVIAGFRRLDENSTTISVADCKRGLRLNVTVRTADCRHSTSTHSDSSDVSTSHVCGSHGRCLAAKYYAVSGFLE